MKFHGTLETINKIKEIINKKEKGVYLRFGDGDVNLANDQPELHQDTNFGIGKEMREAFGINHPNALKTLPLYCKKYNGLEKGMYPGNHECSDEWADDIVQRISEHWGGEMADVYSHCFLHYTACHNPQITWEFLNFIQSSFEHIIFVGNEQIPKPILEKLIPHNNITIIPTINTRSYHQINTTFEMLCESIDATKYTCVITFMGCAGRILQKRMWNNALFNNTFAYDFGSLIDAVSNIDSREWIKNFDCKSFFEIKYGINFLDSLALKYQSDKSSKTHNYTYIYDKHFKDIRLKNLDILEIGVGYGNSLRMWKEYFPHSKIIGVDIIPEAKKYEEENIKIIIGDQKDDGLIQHILDNVNKFDIIIDDGGHFMDQQIITFEKLFKHLHCGGVYVIEDIHSSYMKELYDTVSQRPVVNPPYKGLTTIDYFKAMVDAVNISGKTIDNIFNGNKEWCVRQLEEHSKKLHYFERYIDHIIFYKSMIFIYKTAF